MNDRLLPLGYSRGVLITSFNGLFKYQGKTFVVYDQIVPWDTLVKFPLLSVTNLFGERQLYLARKQQ